MVLGNLIISKNFLSLVMGLILEIEMQYCIYMHCTAVNITYGSLRLS